MDVSTDDDHTELLKAVKEGRLADVELLLREGSDPLWQNEADGESILMAAAKGGHAEICSRLLELGAPWNAIDRNGLCAGDYAIEAGHGDAVDVLVNAGVQAELILGAAFRRLKVEEKASNGDYLQQRVEYSEGRLTDESSSAVMMEWERPLMEAHAHAICRQGGDILNVGFGMGLVDKAIQKRQPTTHTIIEAHPDVYKRMLEEGWGKKPGVRILFGRWQDVLDSLTSYDGIFFDTYAEYYDDLREFHSHVPKLLKPNGIYSFFNGMCGDNAFFHVVYCHIVALELASVGLSTDYISLPVKEHLSSKVWEGLQEHRYWQLDTYFLAVVTHVEENKEEDKEENKEENKEES